MKKFILIVLISLNAYSQSYVSSNLYDLIDSLKQAMPVKDSYLYTIPTAVQRDSFAIIVDQILATNYATAATLADEMGYDVVIWDDTGNASQRYYVLKEDSSQHVSKSSWKGWGTYIFRDNGSAKAAVQVPHPLNDTNTWRVGFESYRANNSRFFMMAGTHRYAN